jgi:uncharacterized protein (TIGR02246 family)
MKRYWVALLLLLATSVNADLAADAKAHSEAFAKAINARDVEAMAAMYANDARVIWPGMGEEARGKAAIEKMIAADMATMPKDAVITFKSQDAIPLGNGYISTVGQWEETFVGDDGKPQSYQIRTSEIIRKHKGKMLYVVDHASIGLPPAPACPNAGK